MESLVFIQRMEKTKQNKAGKAIPLTVHLHLAPLPLPDKRKMVYSIILSALVFMKNGGHNMRAVFSLCKMVGNSKGYTHIVQRNPIVPSVLQKGLLLQTQMFYSKVGIIPL